MLSFKNEFILNLLTRFEKKTYLNKFCFRDYSPKACSDANIFQVIFIHAQFRQTCTAIQLAVEFITLHSAFYIQLFLYKKVLHV